jgi:transcriptional regulator with PAS, ATPase and Fis domain
MTSPAERTLTAQLDAAGANEAAHIPLLLLAARAGATTLDTRERLLILAHSLDLGRRTGTGPTVMPGALALEDPVASSRHARLESRDGHWYVSDQGSKNGTFVNGVRLLSPQQLEDGDVMAVGGHFFVFRVATQTQVDAIRQELQSPLAPVATTSPRLAVLNAKLRRLATSESEVLLVGETGVGKEVYAHALHEASGRRGRFVALNCAAIPRELVESELFGFRPGAHSTAQAGKPGLVEEADGGTLFLDEIGEMPRETQSKMLRFLQDRELTPLGGTRPRRLDVRVVAATNRSVTPGSTEGLRDDLLGRLGASPLWLPPLRDRREDVGALALYFLAQQARKRGAGPTGFDAPALSALLMAGFPLNVRQLEKTVVAAVALCEPGAPVAMAHLPETLSAAPPSSTPLFLRTPETRSGRKPPEPAPTPQDVERLLIQHKGNVADVARALGRQRAAVWRWIKQYGLNPERHR